MQESPVGSLYVETPTQILVHALKVDRSRKVRNTLRRYLRWKVRSAHTYAVERRLRLASLVLYLNVRIGFRKFWPFDSTFLLRNTQDALDFADFFVLHLQVFETRPACAPLEILALGLAL